MAAELQPPGSPVYNLGAPTVAFPSTTDDPGPGLRPARAPKRHRRPSVRLGDIGDQSATLRTSKPWRFNPYPNKSSKTRPLTNLVTTTNGGFNPNSDYSTDTAAATASPHNNGNSHRKLSKEFKSRRTPNSVKRVRTAHLRIDPTLGEDVAEETENGGNNDNHSFHNDDEEGFRDFIPEGLEQEQEQKQQSPVLSADDGALLDAWHGHNRRSIRVAGAASTRISDSHHHLGLDGFPESDSRNRGGFGLELELDDGVRNWLVGLGLGRYAPVFEIHEVDDEVLPHLTLEDLKDMGINAVGSRRKLYSAIQKLQKRLL